MGKLLPILLATVGIAAGGGAGYVLRPPPAEPETVHADGAPCPPGEAHPVVAKGDTNHGGSVATEFVEFENNFVVPVTSSEAVVSLVVLSLTLEVPEGAQEATFGRLPKLRDAFLSVLFDHSSAGGFSAEFVNGKGLEDLRSMLTETAIATAGPEIVDVLIVDLVKQDV